MPRYTWSRGLALTCYFGLLVLLFGWAWFFGPEQMAARLVLGLAICSGLLLVLPGVLRGSKRSYQWLCYILLFYFIWAVQAQFAVPIGDDGNPVESPIPWFDPLRLVFIVAGFVASMLAARWRPQD